jgi:hypothetical protein
MNAINEIKADLIIRMIVIHIVLFSEKNCLLRKPLFSEIRLK